MDNEIKGLIEQIKNATNKEEAIFIIQQYGGGSDESFAKANKDGLLLFAAEILEAYLDKEDQQKNNKDSIGFEGPNESFKDGDTVIDYIKYTDEKRKSFDKGIAKRTPVEENFSKIGCIVVAIILFLIFIAGIVQINSWL
ncbi:MAG: hypothetical protein ABI723_11075 [Bacteroidia bacterium]